MDEEEREYLEWLEEELEDSYKIVLELPSDIDIDEIKGILGSYDIAYRIEEYEE